MGTPFFVNLRTVIQAYEFLPILLFSPRAPSTKDKWRSLAQNGKKAGKIQETSHGRAGPSRAFR
jgi:hypothetical protein